MPNVNDWFESCVEEVKRARGDCPEAVLAELHRLLAEQLQARALSRGELAKVASRLLTLAQSQPNEGDDE